MLTVAIVSVVTVAALAGFLGWKVVEESTWSTPIQCKPPELPKDKATALIDLVNSLG